MPIKVTCSCGQNLGVPDALAGKAVKCPKCSKPVKVPGAASPAGPSAASPSPTSSKTPTQSSPLAGNAGLSPLTDLFDQAGLTQRQGTFCPSCDKALSPGTTICVSCGFHLEQGNKVEGFQVEKKEFGNKRLVEAADMMRREAETEKRLLNVGFPWWMLLGILMGILIMVVSILIKLDEKTSGEQSNIVLFAKLQRATFGNVLMMSAGLGATAISTFATFAVIATAFKENLKEGFLSLLVPFYVFYYMFSRINTKRLTNTVVILIVTGLIGAVFLGLSLPRI